MAESVLKEIFPLFEDNSTRISRQQLDELKEAGKIGSVRSEVIQIVLEQLKANPNSDRVSLLRSILFKSRDESVKKETIQELVRLKTAELSEILSSYLKTNKLNSPSKVEAIRAYSKDSLKRYLDRR